MKLAVLSDIHGNWPGLMVVADHIERWQPDLVIVNGDVINRGPNSAACWDFVQQKRRDCVQSIYKSGFRRKPGMVQLHPENSSGEPECNLVGNDGIV